MEMSLSEFVALKGGQGQAAIALGVTQGAVWQALQAGREITVHLEAGGAVIDAYERKPFGRVKFDDSAAA